MRRRAGEGRAALATEALAGAIGGPARGTAVAEPAPATAAIEAVRPVRLATGVAVRCAARHRFKHSIGRGIMKDAIVKEFQAMRAKAGG